MMTNPKEHIANLLIINPMDASIHIPMYSLDENNNTFECDREEFKRIIEDLSRRRVDLSYIDYYEVSTVFLGIDHNFSCGAPLLFETMIFFRGTRKELYTRRYSTWDEAVKGHEEAKNHLQRHINENCFSEEE